LLIFMIIKPILTATLPQDDDIGAKMAGEAGAAGAGATAAAGGVAVGPGAPAVNIQGGGAGQPDAKLPSDASVETAAAAISPDEVAAPKDDIGYIQPTSGQGDVKPSGSGTQTELNEINSNIA